MADISIYFQPVEYNTSSDESPLKGRLADNISFYSEKGDFPDYMGADLAIIGINEERGTLNNAGCAQAPDVVRGYLGDLFVAAQDWKIVDLGNISPGATIQDTYFAIGSAVQELISCNTIPVIVGGSQDLTYGNYLAYEKLGNTINIVSVDRKLDLEANDDVFSSDTYLSKIILSEPNFLFNYSNIGYQTYFVDQRLLELMDKLYFDAMRLGEVRANVQNTEPVLRHADMVSFDISAIRASDSTGSSNVGPNGLYAEEACQLCRYAGMSDRVSSVGFYELNPMIDRKGQSAHLVAQMIWCFVEGYYNRKEDVPLDNNKQYSKYRVAVKDDAYEIVFYKSHKTDRWWMDVPYTAGNRNKYERHHLVPCTYDDYLLASQEEMPDKWWRTYQKLV